MLSYTWFIARLFFYMEAAPVGAAWAAGAGPQRTAAPEQRYFIGKFKYCIFVELYAGGKFYFFDEDSINISI